MPGLDRADTGAIRLAERRLPETPFDGGQLSERELIVYSALLATDTDQYSGQTNDLPRRAKAVVALLNDALKNGTEEQSSPCPAGGRCVLEGDKHDDWMHVDGDGNEWPVTEVELEAALTEVGLSDRRL